MKIFKSVLFVLSVASISSCEKGSMWNKEEGTLKDYSGLDGCGWVILSGDKIYEPLNLSDFNISLEEDKEVKFSFEAEEEMGSFCMTGQIIRIRQIK